MRDDFFSRTNTHATVSVKHIAYTYIHYALAHQLQQLQSDGCSDFTADSEFRENLYI